METVPHRLPVAVAVPTNATAIPIQFRALTAPVSDQMTRAAPTKERIISVQCFPLMTCGEARCPVDIFLPSLAASHTSPISISW